MRIVGAKKRTSVDASISENVFFWSFEVLKNQVSHLIRFVLLPDSRFLYILCDKRKKDLFEKIRYKRPINPKILHDKISTQLFYEKFLFFFVGRFSKTLILN